MTTALITTEINAVKLFEENGLDPVLDEIKKKIDDFKPDATTNKGRKEIVSFAHKIARSKTFIDNAGKELVSTIKAKSKLIDAERKRARDYLDEQKEIVRQPFVDWEISEKEKMEKVRLEILFNEDHEEAIAENTLFDREKAMALKEAEIAKAEADRKAKEEAEQAEKDRIANEERIKADAEKQAKFNAAEVIKWAKIKRITDLGLVIDSEDTQWSKEDIHISVVEFKTLSDTEFDKTLENIKIEIKRRADAKIESDRIAAKEKAKTDQIAAVKKAKDDAEQKAKEKQYLADLESMRKREEAQAKSENKRHRAHVNNKIKECLMQIKGVDEELAKHIIIATAKNEIEFLKILY